MTAALPVSSCWIIIEKLAGIQNQAIGLAEALGVPFELKEVSRPKNLWQKLFQHETPLAPPWPDLVISCGRLSIAPSLAVRKANAGKTFNVHIQNPYQCLKYFDAVIVPAHDKIHGDNVFSTQGAVHHVTAEKLAKAAVRFAPLFESLPRPLLAVLVGGKNKHQDFTPQTLFDFSAQLASAATESGGSLAITLSRRTGKNNERGLRGYLEKTPSFIWNGQGENPYFGLLALADAIIVTSDSVSMISEACSTGKPVYVFDLPGAGKRLKSFLENLRLKGITRPFTGKIETWGYKPLDDTRQAADFIRKRYFQKNSTASFSETYQLMAV